MDKQGESRDVAELVFPDDEFPKSNSSLSRKTRNRGGETKSKPKNPIVATQLTTQGSSTKVAVSGSGKHSSWGKKSRCSDIQIRPSQLKSPSLKGSARNSGSSSPIYTSKNGWRKSQASSKSTGSRFSPKKGTKKDYDELPSLSSNPPPKEEQLPQVHVPEPSSESVQVRKALDRLIDDLECKKLEYTERSREEIAKLKPKLKKEKITISNPSPEKIEEAVNQREFEHKMIESSITESEKCKEVFLQYHRETASKLKELNIENNISLATVDSLHRSLDREVKRCNNRLPIYAQRLDIMEMIARKQVSIVIGETGSGKSTQLVQYLHEARYSSTRLIACTQPRKLAAVSLAEHVSKEVNEIVGVSYGYISTKNKLSERTGVVYMTDHTLLNECIADPYFSKYSCLVIDEAHERSIHTDILIAFIKRCLPHRPDLKVIVTSATIKPSLFSSYFGGEEECPIIKVPGRIYPVQVHWGEAQSADQDYVGEAVEKVNDIHVRKQGQPGDILVFLTCPAEIERACKLTQQVLKNEAIVLPLHGKLQPEDQQKVFDTKSRKRKVVFSTNVAETSVTIPGIVYVIDTGLSKEMCYDPQKNMNSLEIKPISKSSADQRKGRAGRTCPGECYRLYSEDDYAAMRDDSTPEILRITLAFAVIKLYEFGIKDIHLFEFVESPDRKALEDATRNLEFLGAIRGKSLTKLGKKMALLPLEPNLSKVLLDGASQDIGIEAAAAVAISSLAGQVFFRPITTELQEESDGKRMKFCQQSGDQMTYLHTFFQWSLQSKKNKIKWCGDNYVNSKSMRMVQQIVDELRFTLKKCKIFISPVIKSLDKADQRLPKIFFYAFLQNICVHLGHNAVGYWSEKVPTEQLVIHPASALRHLSSIPQCVVYEKTQKTSQHFLLQALPVRKEWIAEAIKSRQLECHPTENSLFQFCQVFPLSFNNLGHRVMFKLRYKYPSDRRRMIAEFIDFDIQPAIEYLYDQGALIVYAQKQYREEIHESITKYIEECKEELKHESHTCGLTTETDDVKIVIGLGGCIQSVLMPGDCQTVVVKGLSLEEDISAAKKELCLYGKCTSNISRDLLFIKFQNPADAENALKHQFTDARVKIQYYRERNKNHFCLNVEWQRRERLSYAYINFNMEDYQKIYSRYIFGHKRSNSDGLGFDLQDENPSIRVMAIQKNTTEESIITQLHALFPLSKNVEFNIRFLYTKKFEDNNDSFSIQRDHLIAHLSECAPQSEYYVEFFRPSIQHVKYKAVVYFNDTSLCSRMLKHLSKKHLQAENEGGDDDDNVYVDDAVEGADESGTDEYFCNDYDDSSDDESEVTELKYHVEMSLSSSTRYSTKIFTVIKPSVEEISYYFSSITSSVAIEYNKQDRWDNTFVNVKANNLSAFTDAKRELTEAVQPDTIAFTDYKKSHYASTYNFRMAMEEIQERTLTYIKISSSSLCTSSIAIYGTKDKREMAKREVELHLQSVLLDGVDCFEINLKDFSPGLMKYLVREYGSNVSGLTSATTDITAARLDPRKQILTLFANEAGHKFILQLLDGYSGGDTVIQQAQVLRSDTDAIECCICFESLDFKHKKMFYYRLEICGHVYCRECIEQQLESSSITFPVTCAADSCGEQLVWRDFENIFKDKVKEFRDITSASLRSYVAENSEKIDNCITPDCEMLFVVSEEGKRFVCGHCGENICTRCCSTWHEGFESCVMFRIRGMGDAELEKWMKDDPRNRKRCPNCSLPIEKDDGCFHMTCKQCKNHFCWHCLKLFPSANKCEGHLIRTHGSLF